MRRLMLLRHAKSDWASPSMQDHDRPLAPRGRETAPRMGAYMAREGLVPDLALCSGALRTRETLDLVSCAFAHGFPTAVDDRLYGATPEQILDVIREASGEAATLLVVGHNPGFHVLANALAGRGEATIRARLQDKFPTCALAVVEFAAEINPGAGRLERFVTPRQIA